MAPHDIHDKVVDGLLATSTIVAGISLVQIQSTVAIVAGIFSIVGVCFAIRYYRVKTRALEKALRDAED